MATRKCNKTAPVDIDYKESLTLSQFSFVVYTLFLYIINQEF